MADDPKPEIDDFDERLRKLEARADEIHSTRQSKRREIRRLQHSERESAIGLGTGLSIAYTLIGMPLLGAAIGWFLEQRGLRGSMALGVLIGAVVGLFAAFMMLGRANPRQ
jgi:F0F1-type ATP synthase assembly protein I